MAAWTGKQMAAVLDEMLVDDWVALMGVPMAGWKDAMMGNAKVML